MASRSRDLSVRDPFNNVAIPIRVLICSKHRVFRAGLRLLVETGDTITVVGEADAVTSILGLVQVERPDIILLDDDLCDTVPETVWIALRTSLPTARVLLLMEGRERRLPLSLAAHAELGVVSKAETPDVLLDAIRRLYSGEPFVSHSVEVSEPPYQLSLDVITDDGDDVFQDALPPIHRIAISDKRVLVVLRAVDDDLRRSDSIDVLARTVGIGGSRLRHLLRDTIGTSLSQFRKERRLHVAAHLLAHGHKRVSEIAYAVGFGDVAYFNKEFRKRFGLSPTRYRQNVTTPLDH